jgi:hypothetical protein
MIPAAYNQAVKAVAVGLVLALVLTGCASEGPLPDGHWFLPYRPEAGPLVWLAHTAGNVGLVAIYIGACAANVLQGLHGTIRT